MKIFVGVCFDSLQVLGLRFGNPRPKLEKPYKKCRVLIECAEADRHPRKFHQTTLFVALVRLLVHELLGLQLRRLLRWGALSARARGFTFCVYFDRNMDENSIQMVKSTVEY